MIAFFLSAFLYLKFVYYLPPCAPFVPVFPPPPKDPETVGRVLSQIDKCNGYILGAHDTAIGGAGAAGGGGAGGSVSNLFRTAFSDTHEPMFEKVGSVQERYMPETYGAVPPELLINSAAEPDRSGLRAGRDSSAERRL